MFQLTSEELESLRSQFATSNHPLNRRGSPKIICVSLFLLFDIAEEKNAGSRVDEIHSEWFETHILLDFFYLYLHFSPIKGIYVAIFLSPLRTISSSSALVERVRLGGQSNAIPTPSA